MRRLVLILILSLTLLGCDALKDKPVPTPAPTPAATPAAAPAIDPEVTAAAKTISDLLNEKPPNTAGIAKLLSDKPRVVPEVLAILLTEKPQIIGAINYHDYILKRAGQEPSFKPAYDVAVKEWQAKMAEAAKAQTVEEQAKRIAELEAKLKEKDAKAAPVAPTPVPAK